MIAPSHLNLSQLIERLAREDPDRVVPVGFNEPHSYRCYYEQLAFELAADVRIGDMLDAARSCLGRTFEGWKGGDYEMREYTDVWLVREEGTSQGETLGAVLLEFLLRPTDAELRISLERLAGAAEKFFEQKDWDAEAQAANHRALGERTTDAWLLLRR